MTVYYKATRPDGYDFATGTVFYEVGKRVRPKPYPCEDARICGPGFLHAADVPAMTLAGGTWPCRLFEVTGRPVVGFDARHPHKGGFRQLTVLREIDAHLALGPNGRDVAAIIDRARALTPGEMRRLDAAWVTARDAAWVGARDAARDAAGVAAWVGARAGAWAAAWGAAWVGARVAAWVGARAGAWDVAVEAAALATLVHDLITTEQFDLLYGPWKEAIG